jgi:Flp pilus assembly protein TadD
MYLSTPSRRHAAHCAALATMLLSAVAVAAPPDPASRQAPATSFSTLAARAAKAKEAGQLDEAVRLYRRAVAERPSWLEGRWALGTLHYDRNEFAEARDQFDRIVKARPGDSQALALLGLCRAGVGENEAALEALMKARKLGIGSPAIRSVAAFQTAVLLNRLGDPDGAFEVLRPFAVDGDDRPQVIEAFGLIMLRMPLLPGQVPPEKREMVLLAGRGGYHMARARRTEIGRLALEELVSRYPETSNVHYALGMYLLPDDPAGAVQEFHRELKVTPEHYVAMIQLALTELKRGRAAEALPQAEHAARLAPTVPAARLALARALLALGQVDRGVHEMEEASRLAPANPRLRYDLAQAYAQAGRAEDAARERGVFLKLQKAASASPAQPGGDPGAPPPDSH